MKEQSEIRVDEKTNEELEQIARRLLAFELDLKNIIYFVTAQC